MMYNDNFRSTDAGTWVGVRRQENQDNFWVGYYNGGAVAVVCDGMGGLEKGREASSRAIQVIREEILKGKSIGEAVHKANKEVIKRSYGTTSGTTCTAVEMVDSGKYEIYHAGDSRCYAGGIERYRLITEDHSAIKFYQKIGKEVPIGKEKEIQSKLTNCLGVYENFNPSRYEGTLLEDEYIFICSDGVWHYIEEYNLNPFDYYGKIDEIFDEAVKFGESDNMTAVYLKQGGNDGIA